MYALEKNCSYVARRSVKPFEALRQTGTWLRGRNFMPYKPWPQWMRKVMGWFVSWKNHSICQWHTKQEIPGDRKELKDMHTYTFLTAKDLAAVLSSTDVGKEGKTVKTPLAFQEVSQTPKKIKPLYSWQTHLYQTSWMRLMRTHFFTDNGLKIKSTEAILPHLTGTRMFIVKKLKSGREQIKSR